MKNTTMERGRENPTGSPPDATIKGAGSEKEGKVGKKPGILSLGKASPSLIGLVIILRILNLVSNVVLIERISLGIHLFLNGVMVPGTLVNIIITCILFTAIRFCVTWLLNHAQYRISSKIKRDVRERIYDRVIGLELRYNDVTPTGKLVTTAIEGVEHLESFFGLFLPQLFVAIAGPVVLFFYFRTLNPVIAVTLLLQVILIPVSIGIVNAWVQRVAKVNWETFTDMNVLFLDSIQGMNVLKLYKAIRIQRDLIETSSESVRVKTMKLLSANLVSILVMDLVAMVGTAVGIVQGLYGLGTGAITVYAAIIIILLSYEFFRPLRMLGSFFHVAIQGISAAKSIVELLGTDSSHESKNNNSQLPDLSRVPILFDHVGFEYGKDSPCVLDDVSFRIEPGKTTAIVGKSGSGKTTIVKLLAKFYAPTRGDILVGRQSLKSFDKETMRDAMAVVSQQTYLFYGTIRDNLQMAKPGASDEELLEACSKAGILDFVMEKQGGLDAMLKERGRNLSGGQLQRIALARALLKDAPLLLLDEATSNVDSDNEKHIQEALGEISTNKTTLVIGHRLSAVKDADRIIVLENGSITEEGTHDELMGSGGDYYKLFQEQARLERNSIMEGMA